MTVFLYKAVDSQGNVVKGTADAPTHESLSEILKKRGLFLMESQLERITPRASTAKNNLVQKAQNKFQATYWKLPFSGREKAPLDAVSIFSTQFAIMLKTGLPIADAMHSLGRQQANPYFKSVVLDVTDKVQSGQSISSAMMPYSNVFDHVYVSLVTAGETSGNMPLMLERISSYVNFQRELKAKVRSALLYPTMILLTSCAVVSFLVVFILPTFAAMFKEMSMALPWPTRFLLGVSTHLRHWWFMYTVVAAGIWIYLYRWISDPTHFKPIHTIQLDLPVIGSLMRNIVMTRVLRTLGALVSSGVPILHSLELAGESADNLVFHDILQRVHQNASEGKGLSVGLFNNPYIPEQVAQMIENGEKTGTLPDVLNKISEFYEKETDTALRNVFAVIEPVFVIVLGSVIAGIAISILLPIFQMNNINFG